MFSSVLALLAITMVSAAPGDEPEALLSPIVSLPPVVGVVLRADRVSVLLAEPWIFQFGGRARPGGWHRLQFVIEPALIVHARVEMKELRLDHGFEVTWGMRRLWMPLPRVGIAAGFLLTHSEAAPASPVPVGEIQVTWGGTRGMFSYGIATRALLRRSAEPELRVMLALNLW